MNIVAGIGLVVITALLASCGTAPQESPKLPPPAHDYRVAQIDTGNAPSYEMCRDCPRPTRKTLSGQQLRSPAPAPLPQRLTEAPPPKPPRQFKAFIPFEFNSANLTAQAQAQLAAIAPVLQLSTQVQVTGYTDDLGGRDLNTKLSDARALSVLIALRDQLAGRDTAPTLRATGRPLCCYVSDNRTEAQRRPNRRAEVRLTVPDGPALTKALQGVPSTTGLREPADAHTAQAPMAGSRTNNQP